MTTWPNNFFRVKMNKFCYYK